MKKILVLFCIILSACHTIDYNKLPPKEWPPLEVTEHFDASDKMPLASLGYAWIDLDNGTCDIYYAAQHPFQWVQKHEKAHCQGYEHDGDDTLLNLFQIWKSK